jgi:hypothetical protein
MTKQELIDMIRSKKEAVNATDLETKDNFTLDNIKGKEVDDVKPAEGVEHAEENKAGDSKEVAKEVESAVDPVVDADKDGVSKNGGEEELDEKNIEAEKAKEDKAMQDVINVTGRTYEENTEAQNELLSKLDESVKANEKLKEDMATVQALCKEALEAQKEKIAQVNARQTSELIESIIKIGESMEAELNAEIARGKKNLAKVESTLKASNKLNKILREGLIKTRQEKKLVRYESAQMRYRKFAK